MEKITKRGRCFSGRVLAQHVDRDKDIKSFAEVVVKMDSGACSKLFKKEIIDEHGMSFPVGVKVYEDVIFLRTYLKECKKIEVIDKVTYYYNKLVKESTTSHPYIHDQLNDWQIEMLEKVFQIFVGESPEVLDIVIKYAEKIISSMYSYVYISNQDKQSKLKKIEMVRDGNLALLTKYCKIDDIQHVIGLIKAEKSATAIYKELDKENPSLSKWKKILLKNPLRMFFKNTYLWFLRFLVFKLNIKHRV